MRTPQALATCCRIFYCLNYIELPEFFLDNMQTWVAMFLHFLSYSNAALEDPDELMVPGPVETLQTEIMACMALYAEKFDDDFEEHIPKFVDATVRVRPRLPSEPSSPCTRPPRIPLAVEALASRQCWISRQCAQVRRYVGLRHACSGAFGGGAFLAASGRLTRCCPTTPPTALPAHTTDGMLAMQPPELPQCTPSPPPFSGLVTQAIRFLSSVVSKSSQAQLFANPATLQAMCQSAVLPNMALREADEIAFEENPKEYIMRDIEGSSSETRRAAASKMIKGLLVSFSQDVTKLCMGLVDSLMQEYATAPDAKWKEKDAGLALLSALAGLTSLRSKGVQELNPQVDIVAVLKSYIIPELHLTGSEAAKIESTLPTGAAIIKCTCLNFITAFRQHWSAAVMTDLAPLVAMWLKSPMVVVHSYAAVCLERMLTVKEAAQGSSTGTMRVPAPTVKAILNLALSASLQRVAAVGQAAGAASAGSAGVLGRQDGNGENEWMMRLVLRMLVAADTDAAGVIGEVLQVLVKVAEAVLSNPAAPNFNHHMFEAVAVLIKIAVKVHAADPAKVSAAVDELEGALMPLFNTILQKDVTEFVPYVFQLLASLQAHKPAPQPGQHTLSAGMQSLATSLVQASLWERKSNIPALCMLMTAVLAKGAAFMVAQKKIMPVLGVFQKLMSAASTEDYAHHLLRCVILYVPMEVSQASLPTALSVILTRMQTKGSVKTAKAFVVTMCLIANKAGGATAVQLVEAIQPGLFTDLLTSVVLPHANAIIAKHDRRTVIAGLAALAGDVEALLQPANLPQWQAVASVIVQLLEAQADTAASAQHAAAARVEAALESADAAPAGFDTKFSRLAHVSVPGSMQRGGVEYIPAATDLRACWIEKLKGVVQKVGVAQWPALTSQMEAPIAGVLKQYLASAGVTVS